MTSLRVQHNADAVAATLDAVARRQFPFALANGINRTLDEIRIETLRKLPTQFRFRSTRSRRFFESFVVIDPDQRATKTRLRGAVGIQAPLKGSFGNTRRVGILTKFQTGGTFSYPNGMPVAIPTDYLRTQYKTEIPRSMYPKSLGLLERKSIEGGSKIAGAQTRQVGPGRWKTSLRGARRTFAFDPRYHKTANPDVYGVWQRRGRGRDSEPFLLWAYKASIRVPKRLTFLEDAERRARQTLALNIQGQLAYAMDELKQYRAARFARVARAQGRL